MDPISVALGFVIGSILFLCIVLITLGLDDTVVILKPGEMVVSKAYLDSVNEVAEAIVKRQRGQAENDDDA